MFAHVPIRPLAGTLSRVRRRKRLREVTMTSAPVSTNRLSGIRDLAGKYKGVLLDQFGVLHDGQKPYPNAVEALQTLHSSGIKVVLLSNSSQRAIKAYDRLEKLGFEKEWISGVVTSGELAFQNLLNRPSEFWSSLGPRVLHFTWGTRGKVSLDELNLQVVSNVDEVDFILAHGTESIGQPEGGSKFASVEEMMELIGLCAKRGGVPMVVANPDLVTVDGTILRTMPGALGKEYERLGGHVEWMGKPAPIIYQAAMDIMGLKASEVIAIGDSLEHDIRGAQGAEVDSLFICGGIHADEVSLSQENDEELDPDKLEGLYKEFGAQPTYFLPFFKP